VIFCEREKSFRGHIWNNCPNQLLLYGCIRFTEHFSYDAIFNHHRFTAEFDGDRIWQIVHRAAKLRWQNYSDMFFSVAVYL